MSRSEEPSNDPQADMTQKFEPGDGFLLATASGPISHGKAWELYKDACDTAAAQGYGKILMDWVAVTGDLPLRERHALGKEAAEYAHRNRMSLKIALLGQEPTLNRIGVAIAQNRGLNVEAFSVKTFSDRQRALAWLHDPTSSRIRLSAAP
jgi:hypothetical protein